MLNFMLPKYNPSKFAKQNMKKVPQLHLAHCKKDKKDEKYTNLGRNVALGILSSGTWNT